jgi:4a-hydroxytetrahydrobiopterin dehydratase
MKKACSLIDKHCVPCQGGVPPLSQKEAKELLKQLQADWKINDSGHLHKRYKFKDFMAAMNLANKIAAIAEKEGHHPNLTIAWGELQAEIWTHKINGLTESDFILAAKIEAVAYRA